MEGHTTVAEAMAVPATNSAATTETTTAAMVDESERNENVMSGLWQETWLSRTRVEVHEYTETCDAVMCAVYEVEGPAEEEAPNMNVSPAERSLLADHTLWQEEPETSAVFRELTQEEIWKARIEDLAKISEFQALSPYSRQSALECLDTPDS
eukprot:6072447-Amphidinium_carterae.2